MTGDIGRLLAMGGYAAFVWPAYGVALAVLGGLASSPGGVTVRASDALERLQQRGRSQAMTRKQQRLGLLALGMAALGGATALVLVAFNDNLVFFYSPSELKAKAVAADRRVRIGGLVEAQSLSRGRRRPQRLVSRHRRRERRRGRLSGLLPDLFREGQGVVAEGKLGPDGVFAAIERAGQARRELHAARSRRRAEAERALAGRRA